MENAWTIRNALLWGMKQLEAPEYRSPRLDVETLLSLALSLDRTFLYAHPEGIVQDEALQQYKSWVSLRRAHYPIQYIRGNQEFYGRAFIVRPGILIPRPETELLVETCLNLCQEYRPASGPIRILEIGTGCGCIAVTLSAENPELRVTATDIDPLAARTAARNARLLLKDSSWIDFVVSDLGNCISSSCRLDFIVSNPPYVGRKDSESVDPSVRLYEPETAVFSGETGFEFFQRIFTEMRRLLKPEGFLLLEIGSGQAGALEELAGKCGWKLVAVHPDLSRIPRCLVFSLDPDRREDFTGQISF
ncbi:MAG: peptide chain release factor N(5)-glutamine methyltransferase [Acidobacteriota bacterium]